MRLTLKWVNAALRKPYPTMVQIHWPFTGDESDFRDALHGFVARTEEVELLRDAVVALARRIKKLEQFHCEHEFSDYDKGCTEPIFCSKCGALHPDWERTFAHSFGFADGEEPVGCLIIDNVCYRTKASKPKKGKKK